MQIGLVTACYHPLVNGVTRMLAMYQKHFPRHGHQVTIFAPGNPRHNGTEPGVVRVPAVHLREGYYYTPRYSRAAQARLRQMDIIHCHHFVMDLARRYAECPVVFTNHTRYDLYAEARFFLPRRLSRAITRFVWQQSANLSDVIVAPSAALSRVLRDIGVRRPIEVIENGIELRPFQAPHRPLSKRDLGLDEASVLCVYVGRLSLEKGIKPLLAQFALARRMNSRLCLLLVGTGPRHAWLERKARQMGLDRHVRFVGEVPPEAVPNYLHAADVFVTASQSEVHPLTVMEALAAGLPVVGVAAPGLVDLVEPGTTGMLADDHEEGLAVALAALAADARQRRRLGRAARQAGLRHDIHAHVEQLLALYERLRQPRQRAEVLSRA